MAGNALILSWETPTELWVPTVRKAQLFRQQQDDVGMLVQDDITWGNLLDIENSDPTALYTVLYKGALGENVYTINDRDIVRYEAPSTICRIDIQFTRIDGSPDAGRVIEFSDENSGIGEFIRRILTNTTGKAVFYVMPGSELLIRIEGKPNAWNVVIPDVRSIAINDLLARYSSKVDVDPRRSIGANP